jgi:hypothetical protein
LISAPIFLRQTEKVNQILYGMPEQAQAAHIKPEQPRVEAEKLNQSKKTPEASQRRALRRFIDSGINSTGPRPDTFHRWRSAQ